MASTRSRPRGREHARPSAGGVAAEHSTKIYTVAVSGVIVVVAFLALTSVGHVIDAATQHFMLFYAGVFALISLNASVGLGLVATDRMFLNPGRRVFIQSAHRAASFGAVTFLIIHIITEILAQRVHVIDAVIPFLSPFRTFYIGLGTIASDLVILLVITGILRGRFNANGKAWRWRAIHYTAYLSFIFGVWHGLLAGRSGKPYVDWSYGFLVVFVLLGLAVRILSNSLRPKENLSGPPVHESAASASAPLRAAAMFAQFGASRGGQYGGLAATGGQPMLPAPVTGPVLTALPAGSGPAEQGQPYYEPGYEGPARYLGAPRSTATGPQSRLTGSQPRLTGPQPAHPSGPMPRATGPMPRATGSLPRATGPLPRTTGSFPAHPSGPMPRATGPMPRATGSFSSAAGPLPPHPSGPMPQIPAGPMPEADTGPLPPYATGPLRAYETGSLPPYETGPLPPYATGPLPTYATDPLRPYESGSLRPYETGPLRPYETRPLPPYATGPLPPYATGPLPRATGPIRGADPRQQSWPGTGPVARVPDGPRPQSREHRQPDWERHHADGDAGSRSWPADDRWAASGPYPAFPDGQYPRGGTRPMPRDTGRRPQPPSGPMPRAGASMPPPPRPPARRGPAYPGPAASRGDDWYPAEPPWDNGFPETDPDLRYREPGPGMPGYRGSRDNRYGGDRR